jgi:hypothetical protein
MLNEQLRDNLLYLGDPPLNIDAGLLYTDTTNDRVGIGTTSPASKLHVEGPTDVEVRIASTDAVTGRLTRLVLDSGFAGNDASIMLVTDTGLLRFTTAGITGAETRMVIDTNGNVGIGTTSPEAVRLHIRGSGDESGVTIDRAGVAVWKIFGEVDGSLLIRDMVSAGNPYPVRIEQATPSNTLYLASTGEVGIGVADPQNKLHVRGNAIRLERTGAEPFFFFYRPEAVTGYTGGLEFAGLDSANTWTGYSQIRHYVQDMTDGSEDAVLVFRTRRAGTLETDLVVGSWGRVGVRCWPEFDFDIFGTTQLRRVADADATNTLRDSNVLQFQGAYWDGTASVNQALKVYLNMYGALANSFQLDFLDNSDNMRFRMLVDGSIGGFFINGLTGGNTRLEFMEGGGRRYSLGYNANFDRWYLHSSTIELGAVDIIRIPDNQATVDGNSTFDDNAFDFHCQECDWSSAFEAEHCPKCGGKVEWLDDVALVAASTVVNKVYELPKETLKKLERLGIINTYGTLDRPGRPEVFLRLTQSFWFALSAIKQLYEKVKDLELLVDQLSRQRALSA